MSEKLLTKEGIELSNDKLTPSMEDYIEMIYRLSTKNGFTRIQELADKLQVQPPSVTRMVQKLAGIGLVAYEKYGVVMLTDLGKLRGRGLLKRHNIIEVFLRAIGVREAIVEETEKIEHTISEETLRCIANYLRFLEENPEVEERFRSYHRARKGE